MDRDAIRFEHNSHPGKLKVANLAAFNTDEFLATLTDSAVITDEGQEYRGIAAIKAWSDEKYVGAAKVTLDVVEVANSGGKTIATLSTIRVLEPLNCRKCKLELKYCRKCSSEKNRKSAPARGRPTE